MGGVVERVGGGREGAGGSCCVAGRCHQRQLPAVSLEIRRYVADVPPAPPRMRPPPPHSYTAFQLSLNTPWGGECGRGQQAGCLMF